MTVSVSKTYFYIYIFLNFLHFVSVFAWITFSFFVWQTFEPRYPEIYRSFNRKESKGKAMQWLKYLKNPEIKIFEEKNATSRKPISWDSPHRLWIRLTPLMFRNREQAYQLWLHFAFTESEEKNERHHGQVLKICFYNLISALLVVLLLPRWLLERLFVGLMKTHQLWTATLTGSWGPGEKYELNEIKRVIFFNINK